MLARRLSLSAVAALVAGTAALAVAPPAQADICVKTTPDLPPYCPVTETKEMVDDATPDPPPPPPPPPHCALDDPRYPRCTGYLRSEFFFQAANPNSQRQPTTLCKVVIEGATPASAYGYDRVQFRTSNDCDGILRRVDINTRLVNSTQNTVATGSHAYCHQGTHLGCGDLWMASGGDRSGLGWGEYTIEATVRLALDEGQPGDPWVVTPGAQPLDEPGGCAPGDYVTRCVLTMPIELSPV